MVTLENEPIKRAVDQNPYSKDKIAVLAEVSTITLDKVLNGDPKLLLDSVDRIADYLGFDVVLTFKRKVKVKVPA